MTLFQLSNLPLEAWIMIAPTLLRQFVMALVGSAGLVGAGMASVTRDDAFTAADRMQKWAWTAILAGSGIACLSGFGFLGLIGCVFIGIYFFDVRPQINNILRGNYGW